MKRRQGEENEEETGGRERRGDRGKRMKRRQGEENEEETGGRE